MGFDNECILNIQSLAGEYFCPVCRLLVYPNEALQSQCTHLYCKPCLIYVVSTTRACPYDGYLVTEADSKPLFESNKALAETIGKIPVHCLYHRSGCTWQGPLSECTSHCSGCAFGNSPVVCNRCGIQIVHRQVQEHAQNCPGVQTQAQHPKGDQVAVSTGTAASSDQTPAASQAGMPVPQTEASQTTTPLTPAQDPNQQANSTTQAQSAVQAAVPTAEQWYQQQQQQYQQYYHQYPGYDPYQQHYQQYYPYQQQAVAQYQQPQVYMQPQPPLQPQLQAQSQPQPQTQPQSYPQSQLPVAAQPQNQAQVNPQQQTHPAVPPQAPAPPHSHPHPLAQPHLQSHSTQLHLQHVQMPLYQQSHSQMQHPQPQIQAQANSQPHPQHHPAPQLQIHSQTQLPPHAQHHPQPLPQQPASQPSQLMNPNLQPQPQPQPQHPAALAVTGYHSFPQPQTQQQTQPGVLQQALQVHPQGGPQPQLQHPSQMQSQFPQQPPLLRPQQSHVAVQITQQSGLFPSPGQVPNIPPAQQQPVQSYALQAGHTGHQRAVVAPVQQAVHQQHVQQQQPLSGQALPLVQNQVHPQAPHMQQQLHVQPQLRPQALPQSFQQPSHAYAQPHQNIALPPGMQPHQAQSLAGRPMMPLHGVPSQPNPQSAAVMQVRPIQVGSCQQSGHIHWTNNQVQLSSEQPSAATSRPFSDGQGDRIIEKGAEAESSSLKTAKKIDGVDEGGIKTIKSESDLRTADNDNKQAGEVKDVTESLAVKNGEPLVKKVKEEPTEATDDQKDVSNVGQRQTEPTFSEEKKIKDGPLLKTPLQEVEHHEEQRMKLLDKNLIQVSEVFPSHGQVQPSHPTPMVDQGKQHPPPSHYGPSAVHQRPVGPPLLQVPPSGPFHHTHLPGQYPTQIRPFGHAHIPHMGQPLSSPPEHLQQPPYKQPPGHEISPDGIPGHGSASIFGRGPSHYGLPQGEGHETKIFANQKPNYTDGRRLEPPLHPGMPSSMMTMSSAPSVDTSMLGLQDDRFRPLPDDHLNPLPQDPARHNFDRGEFEEVPKHFPRPYHLDTEPASKFGSHFSSLRPFDGGPIGFGMDAAPRPFDKGPHGPNHNSRLKLETMGVSATSRIFPPYHHDGTLHPNEAGERPVPGYGHHVDNLPPRSPGRDCSRGFGTLHGLDDIDVRESHRYDPVSSSFHDSRFPVLPSHLRRGEFDGPGHLQMGEHFRSDDMIGKDGLPKNLWRGEYLGPHNLPSHFRSGEPVGFGAFSGHARMGELTGPGNFGHPRLGEPGYRSSYSLKGFPGDVGNYTGDLDSFDNLRKRKPLNMGWCRICKVDCETVEGLDLHSQTREHQKMAMDMVITIKQNAKKQKSAASDRSLVDGASKLKNASTEGHDIKN